jgi:hypothetical protein
MEFDMDLFKRAILNGTKNLGPFWTFLRVLNGGVDRGCLVGTS